MAIAFGRFFPRAGYEAVRALFRALTGPVASGAIADGLYRQRDGLGLQVVDDDGRELPVEWVMIYDHDSADLEIEVKLVDGDGVERVRSGRKQG